DDVHDARQLVRRQPLAREGDELLGSQRLPLLQGYVGGNRLAAVGIGLADDGRLPDGGMLVKDVLDLARPDLVPGNVDLVLDAVDQVDPAVDIHDGAIPRAQPSAWHRGFRRIGIAPVAGYDGRTADLELADR